MTNNEDWNVKVDGNGWQTFIGVLIVIDALFVVALANLTGHKVTVKVEKEGK